MGLTVVVRKRCCDDRPRCKRCPFVWERLAAAGWARPDGKRCYDVLAPVPKPVLARARRGRARPLPAPA